jgi:hypothetical protein
MKKMFCKTVFVIVNVVNKQIKARKTKDKYLIKNVVITLHGFHTFLSGGRRIKITDRISINRGTGCSIK